jgi:magnesium and cobalt transporter
MTEELLGEVLDEHERPRESVREESEGVALVRADTPVQEVNRVLGLELAVSPEYTTLGGLLMHESGKILKPGEVVQLNDDISVEVIEATSRQIKRVRIRLPRVSQPTPRASL